MQKFTNLDGETFYFNDGGTPNEKPDGRRKEKRFYAMNTLLDFGKYKGKTISRILNEDPAYIVFCIEDVEYFSTSDDIKKLAYEGKEIDNRDYNGKKYRN